MGHLCHGYVSHNQRAHCGSDRLTKHHGSLALECCFGIYEWYEIDVLFLTYRFYHIYIYCFSEMIQEFGTAANQSYPPFIFTHGYDRVPVMASSHRGDRGDY